MKKKNNIIGRQFFVLFVGACALTMFSSCYSPKTSMSQQSPAPVEPKMIAPAAPNTSYITQHSSIIGLQACLPDHQDHPSRTVQDGEKNVTRGLQNSLSTTQASNPPHEKHTDEPIPGILSPDRLDFMVENKTGKTLYITCFAYMRQRPLSEWSWRKSPIYELKSKESVVVKLDTIQLAEDRENTFGSLGVFENRQEAEDSTYELLPDEDNLDLDLLAELHGKKVTIEIERYGFKKPFYDFDFIKTDETNKKHLPSLDFFVKNETGKPIYTCGFIYMKKAKGRWVAAIDDKDDMSVWRFEQTNLLRLEPNETGTIKIEANDAQRDRDYMVAFLGVFNQHEQKIAEESTYELLAPENKVHLGPLLDITGKVIALEVEQYGIGGDIVDFIVKKPNQIDFTKITS